MHPVEQNRAKNSAIAHIVIGGSLLIFGITGQLTKKSEWYGHNDYMTKTALAIWVSIWVLITGILGGVTSRHLKSANEPSTRPWVVAYMTLSIITACFAFSLAGFSSLTLRLQYTTSCDTQPSDTGWETGLALNCIYIVFVLTEAAIAIWSAELCRRSVRCCFQNGFKLQSTSHVLRLDSRERDTCVV
ncbi:uncharacterized protein LOC116615369 [Nematostella vectensis]|uniref:uncharacterized protein LOC116615369 n=1 Tax=Nematostella vectensis TaxID=45351 RepID=UPI0013902CE2|nr:uncharacterized protein LOC116615369 [Nematostella vectensis]